MGPYDHPIRTLDLFPSVNGSLVALLRGLTPADWAKPTPCGEWSVKDVASHLLDGTLRRLSFHRDGWTPTDSPKDPDSFRGVVEFINRLNTEWVGVARRFSPPLLIRMMEAADRELVEFFRTLDPEAPAKWPVAWAGDAESPAWFDIAREYTEKWLHQQHIRQAVGRPGLLDRTHYFPVLDAFMLALPRAFKDVKATVAVEVTGDAGGVWYLQDGRVRSRATAVAATIVIPQEIAWRMFTKGISTEEARAVVRATGDSTLTDPIFTMVSVMA